MFVRLQEIICALVYWCFPACISPQVSGADVERTLVVYPADRTTSTHCKPMSAQRFRISIACFPSQGALAKTSSPTGAVEGQMSKCHHNHRHYRHSFLQLYLQPEGPHFNVVILTVTLIPPAHNMSSVLFKCTTFCLKGSEPMYSCSFYFLLPAKADKPL